MSGRDVPPRARRLGFSAGIAVAWLAIHAALGWVAAPFGDVSPVILGAGAMLQGGDPYALVGPGREIEWGWRFYYPATALLPVLPLAPLPGGWGSAAFVAISMGLLAYATSASGWWRTAMLLSAPTVLSGLAAQWTPLLTAGYLLPALSWIWVAKPNFVLPFLAAGLTRRHVISLAAAGSLLLVASLIWIPGWVGVWSELVEGAPEFRIPLMTPWVGPLILIGLIRWRQPEARLLLGMAMVPQTARIYNAVPLLLVPRSGREMLFLVVCSWVAWLSPAVMFAVGVLEGSIVTMHHTGFVMFLYGPALMVILRRPPSSAPNPREPMQHSNETVRAESADNSR